MKSLDPFQFALSVVNHIPAMVAYWDKDQRCIFANEAYRDWFGKSPEQMLGMQMKELLGPIYEKNLPYIEGALRGEKQVFERQIPVPGGTIRESIATYSPHITDDKVQGFIVHVADVTALRDRERALEQAIIERDKAMSEIRSLKGLIPICTWCKKIRDESQDWHNLESYLADHTDANFSHGMCPGCVAEKMAEINQG